MIVTRIRIITLFVFILIIGVFAPKIFINDESTNILTVEQVRQAKSMARQLLDNPIERSLVIDMATHASDDEQTIVVEAYAFFGIQYATVEIYPDGSARMLWRRLFGDDESNDVQTSQSVNQSQSPDMTNWPTHNVPPWTFKVPSGWKVIAERYKISAVSSDMGTDTIISPANPQDSNDHIVLKVIKANCDPYIDTSFSYKCAFLDAYGGKAVWSLHTYSTNPDTLEAYEGILASFTENGNKATIRRIK